MGESFLSRLAIASYRRKGSRLIFLHVDIDAVTRAVAVTSSVRTGQRFLFCLTVPDVRCGIRLSGETGTVEAERRVFSGVQFAIGGP